MARQLSQASSVTEQMRAVAVWQFLNFAREQSPVGAGLPIQCTLNRVRQLVLLAEERDADKCQPLHCTWMPSV